MQDQPDWVPEGYMIGQLAGHLHKDELGVWHRCYHSCRNLLTNWQFWAGLTLGFPIEHLIYEKLLPFKLLTQWWGL